MNTLYLILIALGFSAGILTTALRSGEDFKSNTTCIDETNEYVEEIDILSEPETKSMNLFDILD